MRPRCGVRDGTATRIQQIQPSHFVVVRQGDDVSRTADEGIDSRVAGFRQIVVAKYSPVSVASIQVNRRERSVAEQALIV